MTGILEYLSFDLENPFEIFLVAKNLPRRAGGAIPAVFDGNETVRIPGGEIEVMQNHDNGDPHFPVQLSDKLPAPRPDS